MRRRSSLARRSAIEWSIRGVLALVTAGLGCVSVAYTLGYLLRASAPAYAHALAPKDGRITAILAASHTGANAGSDERRRADALASRALRQDATSAVAMSTLGINAQVRGDTAGAGRMFAFTEKLSRRDLQTQVWAIENAVGKGDIAGALKHYDIALRTSRAAGDLLFPILASAITDATVRDALAKTLLGRPAWGGNFIDYVAGHGSDAAATARLFMNVRQNGLHVSEGARSAVVNNLFNAGSIDAAWAYYASYTPKATRRLSRDPRFIAVPNSPSSFDWVVVEDAGLTASIQHGEEGGLFDFATSPSAGGPLLRQVQFLPAGRYALEGHSRGIEQEAVSQPYWSLACRDGRELGRVVVQNSTSRNGVFEGRFDVPSGCPVQILTLIARPSDAVSGVSGQIDRVRLFPVADTAGA